MEKIYALKDPITLDIKYIGQTTLSLYRRLTRHVSESLTRKERSLKRDWIRDLIKQELCPIIELLEVTNEPNKRETYWINKYKKTIFNIEESPNYWKRNYKKVYALVVETGSIIEFTNVKEASIKTNTPSSNITRAIYFGNRANNFIWAYSKNFKITNKNLPTWILLTNVKTKRKHLFKTHEETYKFINGTYISNKNGVKYALTHKDKEYKGYMWEYIKEHIKFGELLGTPGEDNQQPSSVNDIKVTEKVQRLTGEESTNKPDTSAEQLKNGFDYYRESMLKEQRLILNPQSTLGIQLPFVE